MLVKFVLYSPEWASQASKLEFPNHKKFYEMKLGLGVMPWPRNILVVLIAIRITGKLNGCLSNMAIFAHYKNNSGIEPCGNGVTVPTWKGPNTQIP